MLAGYQRGIAVGRGYLGPRDVTRKGAAGQRDALFRAAAAVPKTVALVARIEPVARMKRQRNPGIGLPARAPFPDFTSFHPGYKMLTEQPAQNVLAARFAPEFWPTKAKPVARMSVSEIRGAHSSSQAAPGFHGACHRARPLRAGPLGSIRATKQREAERWQTRISNLRTRNLHPSACGGGQRRGAARVRRDALACRRSTAALA